MPDFTHPRTCEDCAGDAYDMMQEDPELTQDEALVLAYLNCANEIHADDVVPSLD